MTLLINAIEVNKYIGITVLCGGGGLLLHMLSSLSLPMNFMTMKKFMSKKRTFILYLRGFITDDYSPKLAKTADTVSNAEPWKSKIGKDKTEENPNDFGSPDKPRGLSIQPCKSEKEEPYIRHSSQGRSECLYLRIE